jgi:LL-diaminopimelate aminotransferase
LPACIAAFHKAVDEMAVESSFRGYGPEQGYAFLREAIATHDFQARGADIQADEIFVSDGAKCDTGNIQELFSQDTRIAIPDPVYPVYLDTNVMAGRTGEFADGRYQGIVYLDSTKENNFVPTLPTEKVDLIYLCFPNNPTGSTITKAELQTWVEYARANKALILFDAAYETFIRNESLPRSIYELEGAREVAIEFRSYSKRRFPVCCLHRHTQKCTGSGKATAAAAFTLELRHCTVQRCSIRCKAAEAVAGRQDSDPRTADYYLQNAIWYAGNGSSVSSSAVRSLRLDRRRTRLLGVF